MTGTEDKEDKTLEGPDTIRGTRFITVDRTRTSSVVRTSGGGLPP